MVEGFSQTGDGQVAVSLSITAERPVSYDEIVAPLRDCTQNFTTLNMYGLTNMQIERK